MHSSEETVFCEQRAQEECRRIFVVLGAIASIVLILSWVLEVIFAFSYPYTQHIINTLPLQMIVCLCGVLCLLFVPMVYRHAIGFSLVMLVVIGSLGGLVLGGIGPISGPTFYGIYILPMFIIFVPCSLFLRVLSTCVVVAGFVTMFFMQHHYVFLLNVNITVSYMATVMVSSIVLGHKNQVRLLENAVVMYRLDKDKVYAINQNEKLAYKLREQAWQAAMLQQELNEVRSTERISIARDLHDDLGQILVSARIELDILEKKLNKQEKLSVAELDHIYEMMFQLEESTRDMIGKLRNPHKLTGLHSLLNSLISNYQRRRTLHVSMDAELLEGLDEERSDFVFRVVQEGLTNAAKYSDAEQWRVIVRKDKEHSMVVMVEDSGSFDIAIASPSKSGWGMLGLQERAKHLNGQVTLKRVDGATQLRAELPLD